MTLSSGVGSAPWVGFQERLGNRLALLWASAEIPWVANLSMRSASKLVYNGASFTARPGCDGRARPNPPDD